MEELTLIAETLVTYNFLPLPLYYVKKVRNDGPEFDSRDPNYITQDHFLPLFLNYLRKRGGGELALTAKILATHL